MDVLVLPVHLDLQDLPLFQKQTEIITRSVFLVLPAPLDHLEFLVSQPGLQSCGHMTPCSPPPDVKPKAASSTS